MDSDIEALDPLVRRVHGPEHGCKCGEPHCQLDGEVWPCSHIDIDGRAALRRQIEAERRARATLIQAALW